MKRLTLAASAALMLLASCSGLTKEAKEMVGDYYNLEMSQEVPVMELKGNGKCIMRAIRSNELTFQVPGKWNVKNDSLIMTLKPEKVTWEGDSTLIGNIPERIAKKVVNFTGTSLTLESGGINYNYYRRGHKD